MTFHQEKDKTVPKKGVARKSENGCKKLKREH